MLSLSHPLRSCSSRLLLHSSSSSLFSLRPSSLFFLPSPNSPNPNRAMSSSNPRNAFDYLMSKGRGGAKKNPPPQTTASPKKRKTLTPPPKPEPTAAPPTTAAASPTTAAASPTPNASPPTAAAESKPEMKEEDSAEVAPPPMKKARSAASVVKERTAQLASRIELLKRKALEFDPNAVAVWGKGDRVPFMFLALTFDLISKESRRIVITDIVCNMLRTVIHTTPEDLLPTVYLSASRIAPPHEGVEFGMGESTIVKALAQACGRSDEYVKQQLTAEGDLGIVAQKSRSSQSMIRMPEPLTVTKVFNTFRALAKESGKDSQEKKKKHFKSLLVAATDVEPQYLTRFLQSKMRIGLAEQTLLAALGQAAVYSEQHSTPPPNIQSTLEEAARIVKQVYSLLPVYDKIIAALLSGGVWNLPKTCTFTLGIPVGPMLAKRSNGVSEIVQKFKDTEYTCEYKYDGERAQIHYMEDGSVEIYSRNAERNTEKFPDVAVAVSRLKKSSVKSFVLDCELVAYDRAENKIRSFQALSTRSRKNVSISDIKVHVAIFAFDMLFHNGQPLIHEQLIARREYLYNSFEEEAGVFQFATSITSNDIDEIHKFLDAAVKSSSEGLIIKTLSQDATYEPSKRSLNWLKLKKDYIDSLGDSLDLVPIAAFHGRGKRTGVYGAFLLACYDDKNEEFQSICKIGTGFSEAELEERSVSLREKVIPKPKAYYSYAESSNANTPDVWFEPSQVWEVKAADLTVSPVYRAAVGIVDDHKGISLRFPRLVRVREDKKPEDATSSDEVAEMYNAQANKTTNHKDDKEDEN